MRCYLAPGKWGDAAVALDADESHHLQRVLRLVAGDRVEAFNGAGGLGEAEIVAVGRNEVVVRLLRRWTVERAGPEITLFQALPREQKMDWILQKATELGVARIQPLYTTHSLIRLSPDKAADRLERWRKIVLNAVKQCGRAWTPELLLPRSLGDGLAASPRPDVLLLGSLMESARPLRQTLESLAPPPRRTIGVLIGPEGDFTPEESRMAVEAGAWPVTFGKDVLRVETAAVYILSAIRYALDG
jgi:16S rRNA (uracil1498-N3)-methyltransferase